MICILETFIQALSALWIIVLDVIYIQVDVKHDPVIAFLKSLTV